MSDLSPTTIFLKSSYDIVEGIFNIPSPTISSLKINKKFLEVLTFTRSTIDKIQGLIDYKQLFWLSLSMCDKKHDFSFLNKLNLDTLHLTNIENFNFAKSLPKRNYRWVDGQKFWKFVDVHSIRIVEEGRWVVKNV